MNKGIHSSQPLADILEASNPIDSVDTEPGIDLNIEEKLTNQINYLDVKLNGLNSDVFGFKAITSLNSGTRVKPFPYVI